MRMVNQKKSKPNVKATFTTPDGNTLKFEGEISMLACTTAMMTVVCNPKTLAAAKLMVDLMIEMQVPLGGTLGDYIKTAFGVPGEGLVAEWEAAAKTWP